MQRRQVSRVPPRARNIEPSDQFSPRDELAVRTADQEEPAPHHDCLAAMGPRLLSIPLTRQTVHLCIDMQRIFAPGGLWAAPWMERVLPVVVELAGRFPERTIFTRFIPPQRPDDMPGMWQVLTRSDVNSVV